jgi:hypothetical protein
VQPAASRYTDWAVPVFSSAHFVGMWTVHRLIILTHSQRTFLRIHRYRPGQAFEVPGGWDSRISRQSAHEGGKVVSPTDRPYLPPVRILGTHFCQRLSRPQGHSAAGKIKSLKSLSDSIGNRTRDLPVCSAVPEPTARICVIIGNISVRMSEFEDSRSAKRFSWNLTLILLKFVDNLQFFLKSSMSNWHFT